MRRAHAYLLLLLGIAGIASRASAAEVDKPLSRPNIVWIVAEDFSPRMGCYGDRLAVTPHLDKLASQGARYTRAFTHAPVCAPSRSGLITGMHPTTIGSHHMRSKLKRPPKLFTQYLQDAGYYVAWPGKTDFNFNVPKGAFSTTKDWTQGESIDLPQPFFAYINFQDTHESRTRAPAESHAKTTSRLKADQRQDPARMVLPPYYPDTPEVRQDVAQHYETATAMDYKAGDVLRKIDASGLKDSTIVIFFGDHGWGLSRGKRWLYDSGIHVPLLVRWPGQIEPGTVRDNLVSFIDFAPTMLALAGAQIPAAMQGKVFLGPKTEERDFVFAARDRMDETYDRIRAVRDQRYKYIRNFEPDLPYAQHIEYMDEMPTMKTWRRLAAEGKLSGPQSLFFASRKPAEELYDLESDPHEINNLAGEREHQDRLTRMGRVLDAWIDETRDLGAVPERELIAQGLVEDVLGPYEERKSRHPKK